MKELLQTADWKQEKHVPVIEFEKKEDNKISVTVSVGKEIDHPNTTAHHIDWIEFYFLPEGSKFPYLIGRYDFATHGASTDGPDSSGVYSEPFINTVFKTEKKGTFKALSYCNIHGLWTNSIET
ncbi:MAG: desulfoferrodoxin family protein [candidate division WOR-3 bacterium]|nr:desulfoferrodoxin family protein [candidate division WOR-3 bacterium]